MQQVKDVTENSVAPTLRGMQVIPWLFVVAVVYELARAQIQAIRPVLVFATCEENYNFLSFPWPDARKPPRLPTPGSNLDSASPDKLPPGPPSYTASTIRLAFDNFPYAIIRTMSYTSALESAGH